MCVPFDCADQEWMGLVVDHFNTLLIEYAEKADHEILSNPFQAKQSGIDLSSIAENMQLNRAQSLMEEMF